MRKLPFKLNRQNIAIALGLLVVVIAAVVIFGGDGGLFGTAGLEDRDNDGVADADDACPDQGDQGYGLQGNGCPNPPPDSDGDGLTDDVDGCPGQGDAGYGLTNGCPNSAPDSDGDGLTDDVDGCPGQGDAGYGLTNGCPNPATDADSDGVFDNDDACPNESDAGYGLTNGCPNPATDADSDGVFDNDDACPNEGDAGYGIQGNGCPNPATDADSDGVFDNDDACPNEGDAGYGLQGSGCPNPATDADSDGVFDNDDSCPNEGDAGNGVDSTGCPIEVAAAVDTDGDGINDDVDSCPNEGDAGNGVDSTGCPIEVAAAVDTDGDGINDDVDSCPNEGDAGNGVDLTGCPVQIVAATGEVAVGFNALIAADGTVSFNDTSSATGDFSITAWAWTFGDGATSSDRSPSHRYASAGDYTVTLTITLSDNTTRQASSLVTITAEQADPMTCNFNIVTEGTTLPITVNFVNTSTNVTSFEWSFGSTEANPPAQVYDTEGTYPVTLTCVGPQGTLQANGFVTVSEGAGATALQVSFSANPRRGEAPLTVQFNGNTTATESITWAWSFGDGATSNEQNPVHTYEAAGVYNISLVVTDANNNTATATGSIEAVAPLIKPEPNFTLSVREGTSPLVITITDATTGGTVTSWNWNFGNGETSSAQGPHQITYTEVGTYTITLDVEGPGGTGRASKDVVVLPSGDKVEAIFSFQRTGEFDNGQEVCFTNTSTGSIASYTWNFGDGATSNEQSPCHFYAETGNFTVSLSVVGTNPAETSTATRRVSIVVGILPPVANFSVNSTSLELGQSLRITNLSEGIISSYSWTFGDGGTSNAENPTYTYNEVGQYSVSLIVEGPGGTSEAKQVAIEVIFPEITCQINGATNLSFYTLQSYSAVIEGLGQREATYRWTLNDEEVSTSTSFEQRFEAAGSFSLSLEVSVEGTIECSVSRTITVAADNFKCDYEGDTTPRLNQAVLFKEKGISGLNGRAIATRTWLVNGEPVGEGSSVSLPNSVAGSYSLTYRLVLEDETPCEKTRTVVVSNATVECRIDGSDWLDAYQTSEYRARQFGAPNGSTVTYNWSTGATSERINFSIAAGTSEVSLSAQILVDGSVECTATKRVRLRDNGRDKLTCSFSGDTSPLLTQTVGYTSSVSNLYSRTATYAWQIGDQVVGDGQNLSYQWAAGGSYTLTFIVTPSEGTPCTTSQTIVVAEQSLFCSIRGADSIAAFQSSNWDASIESATGTNGLSYEWLVNGSPVATGTRLSTSFTENASITLRVLSGGEVSCEASKNVTVTADRFSCQIGGPGSLLFLQEGAFTAKPKNLYGRSATYEWLVNGSSVGSGASLNYAFESSGQQTLTLIGTPDQGTPCEVSRTISVAENSLVCRINGNFSPAAGISYNYGATVEGLGSRQATYSWSLDGTTIGSSNNVGYTFAAEGSATLTLAVTTDQEGIACTVSQALNIRAGQSINAVADPYSGTVPLAVTFNAETQNIDRTTLTWYYPDGSTHRAETSTYLFTQEGEYTIRVTGRGELGQQEASVKVIVGQETDIRAAFLPSRFAGTVPMEVCFTDQSQGDRINSWSWEFGNGQTATAQNPCTVYTEVGVYDVKLTVRNIFDLEATATNRIQTFALGESNISFGVRLEAGGQVCFTGQVPVGTAVDNVTWDFGDGAQETGNLQICHTYTQEGTFNVTMNVVGAELTGSISRSISVRLIGSNELPALSVVGSCIEGGVIFTVRNAGGNMSNPDEYVVVNQANEVIASGTFQLNRDQSTTITVEAFGLLTFRGVGSGITASSDCQPPLLSCQKNNPDRLDCSSLAVTGICLEDGVAAFTITNTGDLGDGDMRAPTEWRIVSREDGTVLQRGEILLLGGETLEVRYEGIGEVQLQADQQIGHPGNSRPNAILECAKRPEPKIEIAGQCVVTDAKESVARFVITNTGDAMPEAATVTVSTGDSFSIQLANGEQVVRDYPNTEGITLSVGDLAQRVVEACEPVAPELTSAAICTTEGTAAFTITNTGGAMLEPTTYTITQNGTTLAAETIQLTAIGEGSSVTITVNALATGNSIELAVNGYPSASASTEGCYALPEVTASGVCNGDGTVSFILTNNGGPMKEAATFTITDTITEEGVVKTGTFQLGGVGSETATQTITVNAPLIGNLNFVSESPELTISASTEGCYALPEITLNGVCNGDGTVSFILTNNGGPLAESVNYTINTSISDTALDSGTFQLTEKGSENGSQTFTVDAPTSGTVTFSAPQLEREITLEGCYADATIAANGVCNGNGTVTFTISNNGGPMEEAISFTVDSIPAGDAPLAQGEFQLGDVNSDDANFAFDVETVLSGEIVLNIPALEIRASLQDCYPEPDVTATGICTGDGTATFVITNNGGPMTEPATYQTNTGIQGTFQLNGAGEEGSNLTFQTGFVLNETVRLTSPQFEIVSAEVQDCTQRLRLTSMCSEDYDNFRVWRVRNPNAFEVPYTWDVYQTQFNGSGTVSAGGEAFFNTPTVEGPNTVRIFVGGRQVDVKASQPPCTQPTLEGTAVCSANGVATFTIVNTGDKMFSSQSTTFTLTAPSGQIVDQGSIQLDSGERFSYETGGEYGVYTLSTDKYQFSINTTCYEPPALEVVGICSENGVASFAVTNSGGDMNLSQAVRNYSIAQLDGEFSTSGQLILGKDETKTFTLDGVYGNFRFSIGQEEIFVDTTCYEPPALAISGQCLVNGFAQFTISNSGGDMSLSEELIRSYTVSGGDETTVDSGEVILGKNESITITIENYGQYTLNIDGEELSVTTEECLEPEDLTFNAVCNENGSSTYTIYNGGGDMQEPRSYSVFNASEEISVTSSNFQLVKGESLIFNVTNSFGELVFNVNTGDQEPITVSTVCYEPPNIEVLGYCEENGSASFVISNSGGSTENFEQNFRYVITNAQGTPVEPVSVELDKNESLTVTVENVYGLLQFRTEDRTILAFTECYEPPALTIEGLCFADGVASFTVTNNGGSMVEASAIEPYVIVDSENNVIRQGLLDLAKSERRTYEVANMSGWVTFRSTLGTVALGTFCAEPEVPETPETPQTPQEPPTFDRPLCGALIDQPTTETIVGVPFPVVDMNPADCAEDQSLPRPAWTPIELGESVCVDWLVYHTNRTGDWEIFRLGADDLFPDASANLTRAEGFVTLSNGRQVPVFDVAPSRSPDSEWIAFASLRNGNWEIYIAAVDNSLTQRVTYNTEAIDIDPMWAPDGLHILYESTRGGGQWDLYMVDILTGEETQLTFSEGNDINGFWSPDGSKIVFQSDRDGFWQIYELDLNNLDAEPRLLSDGIGDDHDPLYSFAGDRILFRSYRDGDNSVIYVMNVDGSNLIRISTPEEDASNHIWGPADTVVAYQSNRTDAEGNNDLDIYVYEFATEQIRLVTDNAIPDYAPTWYCDSPLIVFTSDVTGDPDIYSTPALPIDAEPIIVEEEATHLVDDPNMDQHPQQSPSEENASRGGQLPSPFKNK